MQENPKVNHIRIKPIPLIGRGVTMRPKLQQIPRVAVLQPKRITATQIRRIPTLPAVKGHQPTFQPQNINQLKGIGRGRILVIVANGPSHKAINLPESVGNNLVDTMSINKPDDRIWPTKYWFFCDHSQYRRHIPQWQQYNGIIINTTSIRETKNNCYKIKSIGQLGFSLDLTQGIHIGRSSTYAGMQIAMWMDYPAIFIVGVDMAAVDGKLYPWGTNPDVKDAERIRRFDNEAKSYEYAATHLSEDIRKRFTFCSEFNPYKFVTRFNNIRTDETLTRITEATEKLRQK